ncbi:MAG: hypothetical protein KAY96_01460 [Bacteroidia bacterium]|nr:hypothetical protein [Bacteroidia bacterium]
MFLKNSVECPFSGVFEASVVAVLSPKPKPEGVYWVAIRPFSWMDHWNTGEEWAESSEDHFVLTIGFRFFVASNF